MEDTHALAHLFAHLRLGRVQLVVRGKIHVVDVMREVVAVAVVLEVWNEIVELGLGRLEGPSRRDVDTPDDLIDSHETSNVATLRRLLSYVVGPVFLNALLNRVRSTETPTLPDI